MRQSRRHPISRLWTRGQLTWKELVHQLLKRSLEHDLVDRAAALSFYLLLAFFPLLLTLSSLIGFVLSSQTDTYWHLLDYILRFMPVSAFNMFSEALKQIQDGASGGKLSFGILVSFWSASSGIEAMIEALNVAFAVPSSRRWWKRRLVAMGLTLGIGALLIVALAVLFAGSSLGKLLSHRLPLLENLSRLSGLASASLCLLLVVGSMFLVYGLGPNLKRKDWAGILPGVFLAVTGGLVASSALRFYLGHFGTLGRSYGSLAGVIALMFWLYATAFAVLLGGELNALILSTERNAEQQG